MDKDIKQLIERAKDYNIAGVQPQVVSDLIDALERLTRQLAGVESKTLQPMGVEPHHIINSEEFYSVETVARLQASNAQLQADVENMAAKALDYWVLLDEIKDAFSSGDGNISRGWLGQMIKRINEKELPALAKIEGSK